MTSAGPGAPESEHDPGRMDLGTLDLRVELEAAGAELHHHLLRGDREVAELLGAWIDALLDEWNRRCA